MISRLIQDPWVAFTATLVHFCTSFLHISIKIRDFSKVLYLPFFDIWSNKGLYPLFQSLLFGVFFVVISRIKVDFRKYQSNFKFMLLNNFKSHLGKCRKLQIIGNSGNGTLNPCRCGSVLWVDSFWKRDKKSIRNIINVW